MSRFADAQKKLMDALDTLESTLALIPAPQPVCLLRHTARRRRETAGLSSVHIHASNANDKALDVSGVEVRVLRT